MIEYPYSRRIFRSNYPLSSRIWNCIMEEIQIIFCRFFGNVVNKVTVERGKLGEIEDNLESEFDSRMSAINSLFSSYQDLNVNIEKSKSSTGGE